MKKLSVLSILTIINFFSLSLFGQTANPTPNAQQQAEIDRQNRIERERERRVREDQARSYEQLRNITENRNIRVKPDNQTRSISPLPPVELTKEQKILLQPSTQDLFFYREFLKQPDTGLIKLFSDVDCQQNSRVLRADEECLRWIPNSSFYSFRREKHVSELFADVRYKNGLLISDGFLSQGIMTALGDVSLDKVSLANDELKFLTQYKPEPVSHDAADQMRKIVGGIKVGKYFYRNIWRAAENMTYAIRSIAYRGKIPYRSQGFVFNLLDTDKRKDVIVVFRVVRRNTDGSLTLLWKELDRKESPKLEFPKKKKD